MLTCVDKTENMVPNSIEYAPLHDFRNNRKQLDRPVVFHLFFVILFENRNDVWKLANSSVIDADFIKRHCMACLLSNYVCIILAAENQESRSQSNSILLQESALPLSRGTGKGDSGREIALPSF